LIGFNFQPPVPFTIDEIKLLHLKPGTLRVIQHRTFLEPGDPRGPMDCIADQTRAP